MQGKTEAVQARCEHTFMAQLCLMVRTENWQVRMKALSLAAQQGHTRLRCCFKAVVFNLSTCWSAGRHASHCQAGSRGGTRPPPTLWQLANVHNGDGCAQAERQCQSKGGPP